MIRRGAVIGVVLAAPVIVAALRPSDVRAIFPPYFMAVPGYNPLDDIRAWEDRSYFLDYGRRFVGSQSPAETAYIRSLVEMDRRDAPHRQRRLEVLLVAELAVMAVGVCAYLFLWAKKRSLDALADGLRGWRATRSTLEDLGETIKRRADRRSEPRRN